MGCYPVPHGWRRIAGTSDLSTEQLELVELAILAWGYSRFLLGYARGVCLPFPVDNPLLLWLWVASPMLMVHALSEVLFTHFRMRDHGVCYTKLTAVLHYTPTLHQLAIPTRSRAHEVTLRERVSYEGALVFRISLASLQPVELGAVYADCMRDAFSCRQAQLWADEEVLMESQRVDQGWPLQATETAS